MNNIFIIKNHFYILIYLFYFINIFMCLFNSYFDYLNEVQIF